MSIENVFEENKHLSEDECVMAIHAEGELSIKEAQSEYRRLAIEAGMIKSSAQRKAEWEDAVDGVDLATVEGVDQAKVAGAELEITSITTGKYIKALATELGITLPAIAPRGNPMWSKIVKAFTEEEALDGEREEVIAKIKLVGEYDDIKKAGGLYNKLRKHFGWEAPATMVSQICDWYKSVANDGSVDKQDVIEKALEIGMTEGSANYYVGVFKLTDEILESIK